MSQQIAEFEEELGVQVLRRNPRGVRPTPAGEILYREATAVSAQVPITDSETAAALLGGT